MKSKFIILFSFISLFVALRSNAHEGMYIPSLLGAAHDDMKAMGLKLTAEDLYSVNKSSLKDAIVLFGGGCTGEMVSSEGLMFTNHHCGFDYIQFHSSLQNDYLKNGFWAMNKQEELVCTGLTATFVLRMDDVTPLMLKGIKEGMTAQEKDAIKQANKKQIEEGVKKEGKHISGVVRAFNYGNQYFLIVSKTFNDVRLVGAPPSEIGKFGGDTDNWVWPRHTGDFSVFRVYANEDNEPAAYSAANKPYRPGHYFPVNIWGVKEGDFTMVYGFPGRTEHFLTSYAVDYVLNKSNKMKVHMRETSLGVIDAAMRSSDKLRIQYAAKQSGISNAYKKWIGQDMGLIKFNVIEKKKAEEVAFASKAESAGKYQGLLNEIKALYAKHEQNNLAREGFVEFVLYGPEVFAQAATVRSFFEEYDKLKSENKLEDTRQKLIENVRLFYKDFDLNVEKDLFKRMSGLYSKYVQRDLGPHIVEPYFLKGAGDAVKKVYDKSLFRDSTLLISFIKGYQPKQMKKIQKDPVFMISFGLYDVFQTKINPEYRTWLSGLESLMGQYVAAQQELMPTSTYWNDANSTLRISYGKAEGSAPHDGMSYSYTTTADGILDKYRTGKDDFLIGEKLKSKLEKKEYGDYGYNGELVVCFTGSNHTTGGNSGSPALNANGELIGINFDRSWESTMSDIYYSPEICRNIMVDTRYVLWVIDEYAGAGYLLNEMKIIR